MQAHRLSATPLDVDALATELELPSAFPAAVLDEAARATPRPVGTRIDATDLPLVTIDPPGSLDLDQAVAFEARTGGGWVVHYAIADVGVFVAPGGPLDTESRRRGETLYAPDRRIPLHPDVLGESAMSLLPDVERPAVLWRIEVDADGGIHAFDLQRATVRSRARLDYPAVQRAADRATLPGPIEALPAFGATRRARALADGAIELNLPEQRIEAHDGGWSLTYRSPLPVEIWNSQVSLLTGSVAARLMLEGGVGLLRTLPPAPAEAIGRLRRAAPGLGVTWPAGASPGQVIAALDLSVPRHVAFVDLATELLRGAAYTAFDGEPPAEPGHGGVGGPYAHATAPIRRLGDRFVNEVCVALASGAEVPAWARDALVGLPELLAASSRRARTFDRAVVDGTEACLLEDRVGEAFAAIVVDVEAPRNGPAPEAGGGRVAANRRGTVMLDDPAVTARVEGPDLPLGERTTVRLAVADPITRTVRFHHPA